MNLRRLPALLLLMAGLASAQSLWTLGPTLHLNFGPGKWESMEIPYSAANADFGIQGSIWGAYLLGADLRRRMGTDGRTFSPGVFLKYMY